MTRSVESRELYRGLANDLLPDDAVRQRRAVRSALNPDGTIRPDAARQLLPWQRVDWFLAGTPVAGVNIAAEYRIIPGGRLRRIDAITKRAPTTAPFTAELVAGNDPVGNVSVARGARSGESAVDREVVSGALLRLDVTSAAGYGVTVTAWIEPATGDTT